MMVAVTKANVVVQMQQNHSFRLPSQNWDIGHQNVVYIKH